MNRCALFFCAMTACFATGCVSHTAISRSYDLTRVKRIGVLRFETQAGELNGMENIFARYLIENGFTVVERAMLESVLQEQKISVQGYLSPETTRLIGKILGVDALLMGDVFSYTPEKKDIAVIETKNTMEEPVFQKETRKQPDGSYAEVIRQTGVKVRRETSKLPYTYTIYAQVGLTAKLVDVETGEIIWVGSYTNEGLNTLTAAETAAGYLMRSLRKDWQSSLKKLNGVSRRALAADF